MNKKITSILTYDILPKHSFDESTKNLQHNFIKISNKSKNPNFKTYRCLCEILWNWKYSKIWRYDWATSKLSVLKNYLTKIYLTSKKGSGFVSGIPLSVSIGKSCENEKKIRNDFSHFSPSRSKNENVPGTTILIILTLRTRYLGADLPSP